MDPLHIYLAGPEVFLPDAREIGARKKALCAEFGFVGLYPLESEISASTDKLDERIFAANCALMRQADAGVFNLSPFRGVNADPGTAFELGFFAALAKPVFAYSNCAAPLFDRVAKNFGAHPSDDGPRDADGLLIEDFGNADNLMLDAALKAQGRRILRPQVSLPDLAALDLFRECLSEARRRFG
jgi:nucleoside 2-deoxyribosyltransferase